jgi:SAM-dependent methyltransferase
VYEVGTGDGTPLARLAQKGLAVAGCDVSKGMVEETRKRLRAAKVDPSRVQWGNIEDNSTFANQLSYGPFDAVVAFGVMPHVANDRLALRNMRMFLKEGGKAYVEFRNKLFSLFTFNRYTKAFILDDLLAGVSEKVKAEVARELDGRLALDQPPRRNAPAGSRVSYDDIGAKFHNPLEIHELFHREGFSVARLHWYHYHAAPPMLEGRFQRELWDEAIRMEQAPSTWRGYFLCSAFVVEADAH